MIRRVMETQLPAPVHWQQQQRMIQQLTMMMKTMKTKKIFLVFFLVLDRIFLFSLSDV